MDSGKKARIVGFALVAIISILLIILGVFHWLDSAFNLVDDIQYLGYILLVALALGTAVHLFSRMYEYETGVSIRTLFKLLGACFVVISLIFFYYILDDLLIWSGLDSISDIIDNTVPQVNFELFGLTDIRMPLSSVVTFAFIMLGVSFFIYPLERFVKNRRPWFAISLWICLLIMPFFAFFRDSALVLSIITTTVVLFVLIDFIFMFYLYISLAVQSAGKMRIASILVAIGLVTMILVWVLGIGIFDDALTQSLVQFSTGIFSMVLFNAGFYIMRS
mgnify:CR=1 FL=1